VCCGNYFVSFDYLLRSRKEWLFTEVAERIPTDRHAPHFRRTVKLPPPQLFPVFPARRLSQGCPASIHIDPALYLKYLHAGRIVNIYGFLSLNFKLQLNFPHAVHFFKWYSGGGVQLAPLGTAATNRPIVPTSGDYDDGEFGEMTIGRGNRSTRRRPAPVPLCPPQTAHDARARTRAAAVGSQWLTSRPHGTIMTVSYLRW
jgi:hypothetical protein